MSIFGKIKEAIYGKDPVVTPVPQAAPATAAPKPAAAAPAQAAPYFNKLECFCFSQYTLEAGEKKEWPVAFVIDPKISKDVTTITLSYTFFEIGGSAKTAG